MMDWIKDLSFPSWAEMLTFIGVGSGSGFLGKKLVDKRQNEKISALQQRMTDSEKKITILENAIETNGKFDAQFRETFEKRHEELNGKIDKLGSEMNDRMEKQTDRIIGILKNKP